MIGQTDQSSVASPPAARAEGWLNYSPVNSTPDELLDPAGGVRAHWNGFLSSLAALGPSELACRWAEVQDLIRENGVTYNVYGDPRGMNRPWQPDAIPLVIAAGEAETLARGLTQRARLLETLMRDF